MIECKKRIVVKYKNYEKEMKYIFERVNTNRTVQNDEFGVKNEKTFLDKLNEMSNRVKEF
jgi:hypothetical protein